jgi:hypothetical protein
MYKELESLKILWNVWRILYIESEQKKLVVFLYSNTTYNYHVPFIYKGRIIELL